MGGSIIVCISLYCKMQSHNFKIACACVAVLHILKIGAISRLVHKLEISRLRKFQDCV